MIVTSRVVRASDFREPWLADRAVELGEPVAVNRKMWEYAAIAQVYAEQVVSGGHALGFGVGLEPMSAWLAARNAVVVATDRPDETDDWTRTGQHAQGMAQLYRPGICPDAVVDSLVTFRPLNMNAIDPDLRDFDFTWSAGSFEHIGGIKAGLDFFCSQMRCLKPGGVAAHTTEYNPQPLEGTLDAHNLALFRAQELVYLAEKLAEQGDRLWPLDLASGREEVDLHVEHHPYSSPHIKLSVGQYITTSVLLVARRGGV